MGVVWWLGGTFAAFLYGLALTDHSLTGNVFAVVLSVALLVSVVQMSHVLDDAASWRRYMQAREREEDEANG